MILILLNYRDTNTSQVWGIILVTLAIFRNLFICISFLDFIEELVVSQAIFLKEQSAI